MSQDYIVSARKYRPTTFHSVVGQKSLIQTLKNAIQTGKLAHAYLFCGPRGVGKTTCARIFAKTINCQNLNAEGDACNECDSCRSFNEQRSFNIHELDAASNNSVDNIRELIDQVRIPPQIGKYKVFIIDEVHMLSTAAFNAFLKTLEEPPAHAIFILATTEKQKILPTILSRCQTYDFQRIMLQDIVDHLAYVAKQENINAERQALQVIAQKADGGMRDALSIFDQIASYTGGNVTYQATIDNLNILDCETFFRLTDAALSNNIPAALLLLDQAIRNGFDAQYFIGGWASHLRDVMMSKDPATIRLIESGQEMAMRFQQQGANCSNPFLYKALQIANECDFNYRNSRNKRLSVEIAIINICRLTMPVQAPTVTPQPTTQQATAPQPMASAPSPTARPQQAAPQPKSYTPTSSPAQQSVRQMANSYSAPRPTAPAPSPVTPSRQEPQTAPVQAKTPAPRGSGRAQTSLMYQILPNQQNAASTTSNAPQSLPEMNEKIEESALRRYWKEFTQTIPTEHVLINTMLNCMPEKTDETHFRITVFNQDQKDRLMQRHAEIVNYLRMNLHNSHVDFTIDIAEVENIKAFTPREKLIEMKNDSDVFSKLISYFGLELT